MSPPAHGRLVRSNPVANDATDRRLGAGRHRFGRGLVVVPEHPRAVLVYFHGSNSDTSEGERILGARCADAGVVLVCPSALAQRWDLRAGRDHSDLAATSALLDLVITRVPLTGVIGLAGFGDGASFALGLGLSNGDLVDAVIAFAPGFARPPERVGRPAVLLAHGDNDAVLPIECSRQIVAQLERTALSVSLIEFPGGHEVPAWVAATAVDWLLQR